MAKPTHRVVIVDFLPSQHSIYLSIDDDAVSDLESIGGVVEIGAKFGSDLRHIKISPRYNADEIRKEIEALNDKTGIMDIVREAFSK